MNFYEKIIRQYSNRVSIMYEVIDENNIYINSILSVHKRKGYANDSMRQFINEHKDKNIFLFSSSELGTDRSILDKWYKHLGFEEHENVDYIPYNVTHAIINK